MLKAIFKIFAFVICFAVFSETKTTCEIDISKTFNGFFENSFDEFVADALSKVEKFQEGKHVSSEERTQTKKELREFFSDSSMREQYNRLKQAYSKHKEIMKNLAQLETKNPSLISELRSKSAEIYANKLRASFQGQSMPAFDTYISSAHALIDERHEISATKRKKAHDELNEFFSKMDFKAAYEKLHQAPKTIEKSAKNINEDREHISAEFFKLNEQQTSTNHEILAVLNSIREAVEAFEKNYQMFKKWNKCALANICCRAMSVVISNAAVLSMPDVSVIIAPMLWALPSSLAVIIENETEALVEYAAFHGKTEAEAMSFGKVAIWFMETMILQDPLQQQNS